ncbi:hypothetical protein HJ148_22725 [Vibrio parahaemolyticus]|nr:hypothetical protein [Vibrio parahaemolyticus]
MKSLVFTILLMCGFFVVVFLNPKLATFIVNHEKIITILISFFAVLAAVVAAAIALLVQNKAKRDQQIDVTVECIGFWRDKEFLKKANAVTALIERNKDKRRKGFANFDGWKADAVFIKSKLSNIGKIENRDSPNFISIHDYLSEFEMVAIKVKNKVYDEELIYNQLGLTMYLNGEYYLKDFINEVHKWFPGIYENTLWLLGAWSKKRH